VNGLGIFFFPHLIAGRCWMLHGCTYESQKNQINKDLTGVLFRSKDPYTR
jgi:hypothetical protein